MLTKSEKSYLTHKVPDKTQNLTYQLIWSVDILLGFVHVLVGLFEASVGLFEASVPLKIYHRKLSFYTSIRRVMIETLLIGNQVIFPKGWYNISVGDTVLFLVLLCSYWTYSIVSFVSVLRSRNRQSRGSHYCVYIYLDIYTCSFSLLCCCVLSGLFLFVRFRSRVVPLVLAVSSCSINIEHTLTYTSYAQTSTIRMPNPTT
jgi:hypothetical protein